MQIMKRLTLMLLVGVLAMQPCLGMKDMKSYGLKKAAQWHEIRLKLEYCLEQKIVFDKLQVEQKKAITNLLDLAKQGIEGCYPKTATGGGAGAGTSKVASPAVFNEKKFKAADKKTGKILRAFEACQKAIFYARIATVKRLDDKVSQNIFADLTKERGIFASLVGKDVTKSETDLFDSIGLTDKKLRTMLSKPCDKLIINMALQVMQVMQAKEKAGVEQVQVKEAAKRPAIEAQDFFGELKYYLEKSKKLDKALADLITRSFDPTNLG